MLISFMSLVKVKIWFQKYSQTKRGEVKVMLTHGDWHDFTVSVLKCKEVRKIYRDHPYGLKFYCIILLLHFTLHNIIALEYNFSSCINLSCIFTHFSHCSQK